MAFHLDTAIGFVVGRTCHIMRKAFGKTFSEAGHDVTPEEWVLLNRLWVQDGQRRAELADSTIRDHTTVTRLLDGMEKKGLVRRQTDPTDRRAVQTWLTSDGKKLERELIPVAEKLLGRATRGISPKELEATRKTILKFQANLMEINEESGR